MPVPPRPRLWHHAAVKPLHVVEYIRSHDAVWNLPTGPFDALRDAFPDVTFTRVSSREEADRAIPEADVVYGWAVNRDNFHLAKRLRWIQVTAAGVTPLMFPALVESDVILTNGRGLHSVAMAEHAIGVMLMFVRKLHIARDYQNVRHWAQDVMWADPPPFGTLVDATLGLVGLGSVGGEIATRARAMGMRVIAVRRNPESDGTPADEVWGPDRLGDLMEASDFVILTPPLTDATRGMIGAAEIGRMRPHAVLVNLGRGALVDEKALTQALSTHRIAGAALDVFEKEPLPRDKPLWVMPNVIATPHISGLGPDYWARAVDLFRRNLERFLRDEPLENVVDKRAGY